jgi:outer membrane receptor for ferrienterochelin and colicin
LFISIVAAAIMPLAIAAAGTTGILEGKIVDKENREVLSGVTVSIVGTLQGAASDSEGHFQVNNIPSGTYEVRFSAIGYKTLLYKDVDIHADIRTRLTVELVPAAVQVSEVEIVAQRPMIEKDVTSTNYSLGSTQVDRLPVHSVQDLLSLFPSVTAEGNVRGGKTSEVVYLVDGLPMQDVVAGGAGSALPKSSITEFSIQSGGFEAEYGNALSGVVNIITRRGGDTHSAVARVEKDDWLAGGWDRQVNRSTETELTLSGPIVKNRLHYFAASTLSLTDTRWWQDFQKFFSSPVKQDLSGLAKIDWNLSPSVRITAQNVYSLGWWHDYEFSWRFNLAGIPKRTRSSYRTTVSLSHALSDIVHYKVDFSEYYLRSRIGDEDRNNIPMAPYQYDFFLEYVVSGDRAWWADTKQIIYTGKSDFDIQINPEHIMKVGVEFNQYDISSDVVKYEPQTTYFGKILPELPQLNFSSSYHYLPRSGSAYIQDKLEVEKDGAVVNLGLRYEFLDPRSARPVVEYVTPDSTTGQYQSQVTRFVPATVKSQLSPRMGLSFPLMYNMLLIMNYGHYFQFPLFDYLYSGTNPQTLRNGVSVLVGNPDLKPERTHAWEVGMKYGLGEKTLLTVTYFKKEFIDQIDSKTFLPSKARLAGDYGFAEYVNNAFANAEGLELVLSRYRDENLSGSLSYSLMRTEGVSDYVNQGINLQQWGFPVLNQPYPLSWDQLHTVKLVIDAQLPFGFQCNAVMSYNTGRPYTYFPTVNGYTPQDTTQAFIPNNARLPSNTNVNFKISRKLSFGDLMSLTFYGNVTNMFNADNARWSDSNGRIGGQLGDPSAYYEPRRVTIGARYEL